MVKEKKTLLDSNVLRKKAKARFKENFIELTLPKSDEELRRMVEELKIHQIELEMMNEELEHSRDELEKLLHQYSELYDFAPIGYLTLNKEGKIVNANLKVSTLLKIDRSKLLKLHFIQFVSDNYYNEFNNFLKKLFEEKIKSNLELVIINGNKQLINVRIDATYNKDSQLCKISLIDITEQKETEKKFKQILEHEQLLADIVHNSPLVIGIGYKDGKTDIVNDKFSKFLGYNIEEIKSFNWMEELTPAKWEESELEILSTLNPDKNSLTYEKEMVAKNGEIIPVELSVSGKFDEKGELLYTLAFFKDIVKRKKAEKNLTIYKNIISSTKDGIALLDKNYRYVFVNDSYEKFSGFKQEHLVGKTVEEYLGKEIFNKYIKKNFDLCLQGSLIFYQEWFNYPELGKRFVEVTYYPYYRTNNKIEGVVAVTRDITDLENSQNALKKSETLQKSIFRSAPVGIGVIEDRVIKFVNKKLTEIVGYSEVELIGQKSRILYPSNKEYEYVGNEIYNQIKKFNIGTVETVFKKKNGTLINILLNSSPIDSADLSKGITFSVLDITGRKQAENNLINALNEITELKRQIEAENIYLHDEIKLNKNYDKIIGESKPIKSLLKNIEKVSKSSVTALILGETGTGKELVANAIHTNSSRKNKPLIKVNCSAISSALIESELFGHEKGAFTGAVKQRIGRFELANDGTIFLDEIGDVPLELQSKLLRFLQEGEFERVGSSKTLKVDVRVIAATNRNLEQAVIKGDFRQDLYYRMNVFPIIVPPLRERKEDIQLLVEFFISRFNKKYKKNVKSISKSTLKILENYNWPGNIRELENIIERGILSSVEDILHLESWFTSNENVNKKVENLKLNVVEKEHILKVLKSTNWRIRGINGAANILGLKPTTLEARMKKLGIQRNS